MGAREFTTVEVFEALVAMDPEGWNEGPIGGWLRDMLDSVTTLTEPGDKVDDRESSAIIEWGGKHWRLWYSWSAADESAGQLICAMQHAHMKDGKIVTVMPDLKPSREWMREYIQGAFSETYKCSQVERRMAESWEDVK